MSAAVFTLVFVLYSPDASHMKMITQPYATLDECYANAKRIIDGENARHALANAVCLKPGDASPEITIPRAP